jgi:hypothetical protein
MARRFWLLIYMMRVPLMTLGVLGLVLPLAFQTSMFHGVADLEPSQVIGAALLAFLLVSETMTCAFLVLLYGEERADGWQPNAPAEERVSIWSVVALYVVAAMCYVVFLGSIRDRMLLADPSSTISGLRFILLATKGLLLGALINLAVFLFVLRFGRPQDDCAIEVFALPAFLIFRKSQWINRGVRAVKRRPTSEEFLGTSYGSHGGAISSFLARLLGPGYGSLTNGQPGALGSGHLFAFIMMIVFFAFYIFTGRSVFGQLIQPGPWSHQPAVLSYLLLLVMFWCCLLSGLTFFFDRFRLPALLMLSVAFYILALPNSSDHQFETVERPNSLPLQKPEETFHRVHDNVIVVAAAGGGIQSAAWTSRVLCGLRQQVPQFSEHVAAISAVSGGSVGAMFYLKCLEEQNMNGADGASESSLEAIAWGLTHPDLGRIFLAWLLPSWFHADRGWALEKALLKNTQFRTNDRLLTGENSQTRWPVILLNSTNAETGDPMVFTNGDFPSSPPGNHQLNGFHTLYGGRDVRLETAARMSAAFPYVSPVARPDLPSNGDHYADGGYFDNSGLFTLSEWLKQAAVQLPLGSTHSHPRILLLQIDAFPDTVRSDEGRPQKWYYQLYAPIFAMLNVRSEGQVVRDITSGEDLQQLLNGKGYATAWAKLRYIPITTEEQPCPHQPPLSWHLTHLEKDCIKNAWSNVSESAQKEVLAFLTQEEGYFPEHDCADNRKDKKAAIYVNRCAAK